MEKKTKERLIAMIPFSLTIIVIITVLTDFPSYFWRLVLDYYLNTWVGIIINVLIGINFLLLFARTLQWIINKQTQKEN